MESNLIHLQEVFDKALIFLNRPQIQGQLVAWLIVFLIAAALTKIVWRILRPQLNKIIEHPRLPTRIHWGSKFLVALLQAITFPLLGVFFTRLAVNNLGAQNQLTGLLAQLENIFFIILEFGIFMTILYTNFSVQQVQRYHYRLFVPLLITITILQVLDPLVGVGSLTSIIILQIFNSPITLGALFIVTLGIYFWADGVNALHTFLLNFILGSTNMDEGAAHATLNLFRYAFIILGTIYAFSQLHLDPTTVAAITGGLSVGIGFGLREILSNFVSGILLLIERSLRPGDVVEVEGTMGIIQNLSIRATTVRTLDNIEIVIPNQTFLTSSIKTFTGTEKQVRFSITLRTSLDNDIRQVVALLKTTASNHPEVLAEPAPDVWLQDTFGDNAMAYQLLVWVDAPIRINSVKSEIIQQIWDAFYENKINLTFPDLELHFNDSLSAALSHPNQTVT